jgi:hypothetical protein
LAKEGFRLPVFDESDDPLMPIAHAKQFVLVDSELKIRAYEDGTTADGLAATQAALEQVLAELKSGSEDLPAMPSPPPDKPDIEGLVTDDPKIFTPNLKRRDAVQRRAMEGVEIERNFRFTDRLPQSGIKFVHLPTYDGTKNFKVVHYDHGNGILTADVDGDGLHDLLFINQVGPNHLYRNLGEGRFEDITERAGVALPDPIKITGAFADIENDGDPDLFLTSVRFGNYLFENFGHSSTPVFLDYDNDGRLDIFLSNIGKYTTEDLVQASDDVNEKGEPLYKYYMAYKDSFSGHLKSERLESSILYRNAGKGKYVDVTKEVGLVDFSWTGDITPLDANEDGFQDLYLLNMQGNDEYYENVGGKKFVKKSRELFPKTPWGSMGVKVFDFNNDGKMDIYVTDMHSDMQKDINFNLEKEKMPKVWPESLFQTEGASLFGNAFYKNKGDGSFEEVSNTINAENYWPWGLSVGDLNADGFQDAFVTASMNFNWRYHPNSLLLNDRGQRFLDAEFILGAEPRREGRTAKLWYSLDCDGADRDHPEAKKEGRSGRIVFYEAYGTRASVIFDLDMDGDLDIVTSDWASEPMVLISDLSERKQDLRYLKVQLRGKVSNRDGLGARVELSVGDKTYVQVQDGKSGYMSQSVLPLYFGLAGAAEVDQITVRWPTGKTQVVAGPVAANQQLLVEEE